MNAPYANMVLDPVVVAQYLAKLADLADKGERCLTLDQWRYFKFKNPGAYLPAMAHAGHIRIEISDKNYRTVTICAGPHKGKATLAPAKRSRPYLVIGPARP